MALFKRSGPRAILHVDAVRAVRERPILAGALLIVGASLIWLVVTTTLPYALAPKAPDLALSLNPNHTPALLKKAEELRATYLELVAAAQRGEGTQPPPASGTQATPEAAETSNAPQSPDAPQTANDQDTSNDPQTSADEAPTRAGPATPSVARFSAPITSTRAAERQARIAALREKIRALATRTLQHDPLNARAYRLLGEVATEVDLARRYMKATVRLSRREPVALFWLLQDSVSQGARDEALEYADSLLRTEPNLTPYVVSYLAVLNEDEDGRKALMLKLSEKPKWRDRFFAQLPRVMRDPVSVLRLMVALKDAGEPPTFGERKPLIDRLNRDGHYRLAYNVWLQLLSPDDLKKVGPINNGAFEDPPTGLAYDWVIPRARNAIVEIGAHPSEGDNQSLAFRFSGRRAARAQVTQMLLLEPGVYELRGKMRGALQGKRGMIWKVDCLGQNRVRVGQSEMLSSTDEAWEPFSFRIEIPAEGRCPAQRLALAHDARSASEELVSGTIWFDDIRIESLTTRAEPRESLPTR
jgi:hypothetical protein